MDPRGLNPTYNQIRIVLSLTCRFIECERRRLGRESSKGRDKELNESRASGGFNGENARPREKTDPKKEFVANEEERKRERGERGARREGERRKEGRRRG